MKNIEKYYEKRRHIWKKRFNFIIQHEKYLTDWQKSVMKTMNPKWLTEGQDKTLRQIEKAVRIRLKNPPDPDHVMTEKELRKWEKETGRRF